MFNKQNNYQDGYIALMSAIIISLVLVAVLSTISIVGFAVRANTLEGEYKERSLTLARACVEYATLQLSGKPLYYVTNETVTVTTEGTCTLTTKNGGAWKMMIYASASVENAVTQLQASFDIKKGVLLNVGEVNDFDCSSCGGGSSPA